MKILFFETRDESKKRLQQELSEHELVFFKEAAHEAALSEDDLNADAVSVFIYSNLTKDVLSRFGSLKLIATRSTGFDHIDLEECKAREIAVYNVPHYGENTVAEHTFALILSLSRNVHKSYLRSKQDDFSIEGLRGFDLRGKTLGVIGVGHIGKHVIKIAKGFGMNVIAFDKYQDEILAEVLNFSYISDVEDLLEQADIVSLHMPSSKETEHFMNKERFSKMKQGSILINTSRGDLVDPDVLYEALKSKHIAGAGLDVIEGEEIIKEEKELLFSDRNVEKLKTIFKTKAIFGMENVVFTPHNAFNSQEAIERILITTADNVKSFQEGRDDNRVGS